MPEETRGPWAPTITPADAVAYKLKILKQVDRYRKNEGVRASILDKVIAAIQGHDRWVIIGHSLGSVVALDLVTHLPDYVQVAALVTAASPLSRPKLSDHLKRQHSRFPHDRVGFWVNAYNAWDVVPGGTGISDAFPEAIDVGQDA